MVEGIGQVTQPAVGTLRAIFQWWLDELAGMIPDGVKRLFVGGDDLLVFRFEDDGIAVERSAGGHWKMLGRLAPGAGPAALAALVGSGGAGADGAVIVLPQARAVVRRLTLPAQVEPELARALDYEIERHTPFPSGQACHIHSIAWRDRRAGTVGVDLTVVPRALVESAVPAIRALGVEPVAVTVADGTELPARLIEFRNRNFAPHMPARSAGKGRRRSILALLLCAAAVAAAVSPIQRLGQANDEIQRALPPARERAESALTLERQVQGTEAEIAAVLAARAALPSPTRLLEGLSAALPDDTWLTFLRLGQGQLIIEGRAASAAALVRRLEAVPGFGAVGFGTPVTRDGRDGLEHFQFTIAIPGASP